MHMASRGDPAKDMVLGLEENATDSLIHAREHFLTSDQPRDLKYAILHVFHAVELFLKARLAQAHPILIYSRPEAASDDATTVDFQTLTARLRKVGVDFSEEDMKDLNSLRRVRNSIEHHQFVGSRKEITGYIGQAMRFLETFLDSQMDISLKDNLKDETYQILSEALYTYQERLEKAQQRMAEYIDPRDPKGYEAIQCDWCFHETVLVPDPSSKDRTARCLLCNEKYYVETCSRCGSVILSAQPPDADDGMAICDNCTDYLMSID
jgi:hypothetical protein